MHISQIKIISYFWLGRKGRGEQNFAKLPKKTELSEKFKLPDQRGFKLPEKRTADSRPWANPSS